MLQDFIMKLLLSEELCCQIFVNSFLYQFQKKIYQSYFYLFCEFFKFELKLINQFVCTFLNSSIILPCITKNKNQYQSIFSLIKK